MSELEKVLELIKGHEHKIKRVYTPTSGWVEIKK